MQLVNRRRPYTDETVFPAGSENTNGVLAPSLAGHKELPEPAQNYISLFFAPSASQTVKGDLILGTQRSFSSYTSDWVALIVSITVGALVALGMAAAGAPIISLLVLMWPICLFFRLLLQTKAVRYRIYQNRIDFVTGLISKKVTPLWLFEIRKVTYDCDPWDRITGGGKIRILAMDMLPSHSQETLVEYVIEAIPSQRKGWSTNRFMEELHEELVEAAIVKRRSMKNWFI